MCKTALQFGSELWNLRFLQWWLKTAGLEDVITCNLVEENQSFRRIYCLSHQEMHIRMMWMQKMECQVALWWEKQVFPVCFYSHCKLLPDYTVLHLERQWSWFWSLLLQCHSHMNFTTECWPLHFIVSILRQKNQWRFPVHLQFVCCVFHCNTYGGVLWY